MKRAIILIIIIIAVSVSSTVISVYSAENRKSQVQYIGILPYYSPEKIWVFYKPFINYLNRTTDIKWELRLYHSYDSIIDGICKGEVSIAYLGPNPFGLAYDKCRVKPLLVILDSNGKPFYRSIIFTKDSSIDSLNELKGRKFGFGDKDSTSSYIIPRKLLEDKGITIDMIQPVFFKSHEKIVNAVAKKEVDAGATKESVFERFKGLKFKVLKVSKPLPHHTFCAASDINPDIKEKFMYALLRLKPLHKNSDKVIVKNWDPELRYGFILPPKDYITDILELHGILRKYTDGH